MVVKGAEWTVKCELNINALKIKSDTDLRCYHRYFVGRLIGSVKQLKNVILINHQLVVD